MQTHIPHPRTLVQTDLTHAHFPHTPQPYTYPPNTHTYTHAHAATDSGKTGRKERHEKEGGFPPSQAGALSSEWLQFGAEGHLREAADLPPRGLCTWVPKVPGNWLSSVCPGRAGGRGGGLRRAGLRASSADVGGLSEKVKAKHLVNCNQRYANVSSSDRGERAGGVGEPARVRRGALLTPHCPGPRLAGLESLGSHCNLVVRTVGTAMPPRPRRG